MSASSNMERTGKPIICVLVSFLIVALFLLNSIPMEFIQKKSWEHTDLTSGNEKEGSSRLPDRIFRGGGSEVRIIEIMFNPVGDDRGKEWIAIYNNGTDEQSLDGWGISNSDGEIDALLPDWNLPGASTLYVHFGTGENENDFEDFIGHFHTQNPYEIFNNSGDGAALFTGEMSNSSIIDYMAWEDASVLNFTGGNAGSLAQYAGFWTEGDSIISSTFEEGIALGRTRIDPVLTSSGDWELGRIVINEVMFRECSNSSDSDFGREHVEIRNPTDATVSMDGWSLAVDGGGEYLIGSFDIPPKSFSVVHFERDVHDNDTDMKDGCADIYYTVGTGVLADDNGAVALYSLSGIEDYISWGTGGSGDVTTDAVTAGIWSSGAAVADSFAEGDSLGRDQFSTDTDGVADWSAGGGPFSNGPTIGTLNYYNLMIWDADLFADPGEEWIKISNYGEDVSVNGWKIYNRDGIAVATLPDITFLEDSTLTIYFGVGAEDLDFSDHDGSWYVMGSDGAEPSSKFFNESLDIILITTGELDGESTVTFEIWLEDGFNSRGTRGWFSDAWNAVKDAGKWVVDKVEQAVNVVVDGVLKAAKWLKEKIAQAQAWVLSKIKDGLSFDISLGEYLTLTLSTLAMGWKFHAEANVEFDIPVPGFPVLQLHFAAQGSITIVKGCGGLTSSGQIVLTVGVNVGANIKKLFTLELRAHLRLTITVGNLDIDDFCNPETHQGTVTVGLDIALDLVLGATFKLNTPEYELFDNDWDWNLAQFTWSQTKNYDCCRDPKPKPGPEPGPIPTPPYEPSPPYYCSQEGYSVYADFHVTNTDDVVHDYYAGGSSSTPGWSTMYSMDYAMNVQPGETVGFNPWLNAPPSQEVPHTFEPNIGTPSGSSGGMYARSTDRAGGSSPLSIQGDEYIGSPGEVIALEFPIENMVDDIYLVDMAVWVRDNSTPAFNSSLVMYSSPEKVNISAFTENGWEIAIYNENGVKLYEWGQSVYPVVNFEGERVISVVITIPEDAVFGTLENFTFSVFSSLPNATDVHSQNVTVKIRVQDKVETTIWSDDMEGRATKSGWDNSTGEWQLGEIAYNSPSNNEDGPRVWGTNLSGYAERYVISILHSPVVDLSGYDVVSLRFKHWARALGQFRIYLNSSGYWYQLLSESFLNMNDWDSLSYDITPYLSDEVSVVFYFNLTSMSNYYGWHIDDISFIGIHTGNVIMHEELENETAASNDWDNSTGQWEWGPMGSFIDGPQLSGPYSNMWGTMLNYTVTEGNISILKSPFYNLSGYDVVNLRLWHWMTTIATIKVYVNSGGIETLVANWSGNHYWDEWEFDLIDITDYISDQVQFIFFFNGTLGRSQNYGWYINNISLATIAEGDLVITGISPVAEDDTLPPGSEEITVNVKNQGDVTYTDISVGLLPIYTGGEIIFSDDFETDKGWNTGASAWNRDDDLNFGADTGYSMNIGGATEVRAGRGGSNTEELISPVIDLSDTEEPMLSFRENTWFEGDGIYRCELYLSNNSGLNWSAVPVWGDADNSHGTWEYVEVPLDLYKTANFTMKFVLVSYSRENTPYMVLDEISISARNDDMLEYVVGSIVSLEPGEEKNVTLEMDLAEVGPYELVFFVNCSSDAYMANNYLEIPIYVNQLTTPEISDLSPGDNISGMVDLRIEYDDTETSAARYYYGSASRGDNLTLIGETSSPDSNMVWSTSWDTREVANGDYVLTGEMIDIWGGKVSVNVGVTVWNPVGSIEANFTHQEIEGMPGTFMFTDTSIPQPSGLAIIAYYWDFGDGADSCIESPVHTYEKDGTYSFYHSVTGADGNIYAITAPVVVIGTQKIIELEVNFTMTPEAGITKLTEVRFNDTTEVPVGLALFRTWDFGDGNTSSEPSPTHKYSEVGMYDVNLSLTDGKDHTWALIRKIVVINIQPTADFTMNTTATHVGKNVTFSATSSDLDGNITAWTWSFGDGKAATGKVVEHAYARTGKFEVTLNVTDDDGGWRTISKKVTVLEKEDTIIAVLVVREGEVRTFQYEDESGAFIDVRVAGNCTLVAARLDDDTEGIKDNPPYVRISFYLMLDKEGVLNWTNITISYAGVATNDSINYSAAKIYYFDDPYGWKEAERTGVDVENQVIWANVTHFTIFAAYALPAEGEEPEGGGAGGEEEKEAWYKSSSFIITGVVLLVIIVMLGVFIYARGQKGEEEDEDDDEEEEEEDEKIDEVEEAEEVIKEILEKEDEEEDIDKSEAVEDEEEEEEEEEGDGVEPVVVDEPDIGDVPEAPEVSGKTAEGADEGDDEGGDELDDIEIASEGSDVDEGMDDIQPVPEDTEDELDEDWDELDEIEVASQGADEDEGMDDIQPVPDEPEDELDEDWDELGEIEIADEGSDEEDGSDDIQPVPEEPKDEADEDWDELDDIKLFDETETAPEPPVPEDEDDLVEIAVLKEMPEDEFDDDLDEIDIV